MAKNPPKGLKSLPKNWDAYDNDPRWKEVGRLRREGKDSEANHMVLQIRETWGIFE